MSDEWNQMSNEEQRRHEDELKSDWDTWRAKEKPWWVYLEEWLNVRTD